MKIIVLNGSPKGDNSVTMQYIEYIKKKFQLYDFKIINISRDIKKIEKDMDFFRGILDDVKTCDGVIWAFPLYYLMVHANYKRFIELICERQAEEVFKGKYTISFSTSIHYFDHTAHNYMHAVCEDLEMKYAGFFSAEMHDFFNEEKRKQLYDFAKDFFGTIETYAPVSKAYKRLNYKMPEYINGKPIEKVDLKSKKVIVVTDSFDINENLGKMILHLRGTFIEQLEIINLSDLNIKGGCLGCLHCGFDNICVYDGNDDIRKIYEEKLVKADALIYAGTIKDRFLSSKWKTLMDRSFFNTHQPNLKGKQIGYFISGPISGIVNLREIIQAYVEMNEANLVDIITDEYEGSKELDAQIENFARRLINCAVEKRTNSETFLGVAGTKLFRDEFWGKLRFVFQKDHKYYKKHHKYDFPQKDIKTIITNLIMILLTKVPSMKKNIQKDFTKYMVNPYKKILNSDKI